MVTKIQSLHFDADQRLVMLVEEKIEKLKHYFKADASAEVILKALKVKAREIELFFLCNSPYERSK